MKEYTQDGFKHWLQNPGTKDVATRPQEAAFQEDEHKEGGVVKELETRYVSTWLVYGY